MKFHVLRKYNKSMTNKSNESTEKIKTIMENYTGRKIYGLQLIIKSTLATRQHYSCVNLIECIPYDYDR